MTKAEDLKECATDSDSEMISEIESQSVAFQTEEEKDVQNSFSENFPLPSPFVQDFSGSNVFFVRKGNRNFRISREQAEKYRSLGDMITQGDGLCLIDLDKRTIRWYVEGILSNYSLSPLAQRMKQVFSALAVIFVFSLISVFKSGFDEKYIDASEKRLTEKIESIRKEIGIPKNSGNSEYSPAFIPENTSSGVKITNIRKLD